jgi:hypothetical protein
MVQVSGSGVVAVRDMMMMMMMMMSYRPDLRRECASLGIVASSITPDSYCLAIGGYVVESLTRDEVTLSCIELCAIFVRNLTFFRYLISTYYVIGTRRPS